MIEKGELVQIRKNEEFDRPEDEIGIIMSRLTPAPLPGQSRMYTVLVNNSIEIVFEGELTKLAGAAQDCA